MKNIDKWEPSKFVYRNGKLIASRNGNEVGVASRLVSDIIANLYDINIKQHVKGRLLDLGCGKVPLYEAYKNYIVENVCVDWGNSLHKNEYLDYECDLTSDLPFCDKEFDTIILSDVLEHIPQPDKLWSEMSRVLNDGGKIILNVPFYYWIHERPYDYYRYTEYALKRFVNNSGLKLIKMGAIGGSPEIVADILSKHFMSVPIVGTYLAIAIQSLVYFIVRSRLGTNMSKKSSAHFPLGYFMIAEK